MNKHEINKEYYEDIIEWCLWRCYQTTIIRQSNGTINCFDHHGNLVSTKCSTCAYNARPYVLLQNEMII